MTARERELPDGRGDEILVEGRVQECPVDGCDYEGACVGRHVSHKHPDEWAEFDVKRVWVRTSEGNAFFEEVNSGE